jgi:hypothetical protein
VNEREDCAERDEEHAEGEKSGARPRYMRAEAVRICPHLRRRATRNGAEGLQTVRVAAKSASASTAASTRSVVSGSLSSWMRPRDPVSTAEHKKSVALVPSTPAVGTA